MVEVCELPVICIFNCKSVMSWQLFMVSIKHF